MNRTGKVIQIVFTIMLVLFLVTAVHGAPITYELDGAAGELAFPGSPLTLQEGQELSRKFGGEASLTLVYEGTAATFDGVAFHYAPGSGTVFELTVTNATGSATYSFSEYRVFVDNTAHLDTLIFTPLIAKDASITLSTERVVDLDIGLIWSDATGTTLSSSTALPATLNFDKLDIRGYSFIFVNPADNTEIGRMIGALVPTP